MGLAIRQGAYALVGLGAYALMVRMPPESIRRLGPVALAVSGFLLLVVLVPSIGMTVNGSRRWISLGGLGQLQPSELAKVALALWLAGYVATAKGRLRTPGGLAPPLIVTGVLGLLILIEPDMGTASSLCVVGLAMLVVAGARMRHIGAVVGTLFMLATIAMLAEPYRRERFFTFLDPWADPNGSGFQSVQAQVAIGSGGLHGVGLGDGVQKAFYLPEAHTDMILATVGEELGLIGVLAVLAGFAPLRPRGLPHRDRRPRRARPGARRRADHAGGDAGLHQRRRRGRRAPGDGRTATLRLVRGELPHRPPRRLGATCQHRTPIAPPRRPGPPPGPSG